MTDPIVILIDLMRTADIRRRAVLLAEVADIERRWALGRFANQPPQIDVNNFENHTESLDTAEHKC